MLNKQKSSKYCNLAIFVATKIWCALPLRYQLGSYLAHDDSLKIPTMCRTAGTSGAFRG